MSQVYLIHGVSQVCCCLIDFLSGCFILCWTWDLKDSLCHFLSKSSIDKFLQLSFGKSFSLFHFWRTVLPHISLLIGSFFFFAFGPLNILFLCLLNCKVSTEKSAHCLMRNPLCMMSHFSLTDFTIVFVFEQFDYILSWDAVIWIYHIWASWIWISVFLLGIRNFCP